MEGAAGAGWVAEKAVAADHQLVVVHLQQRRRDGIGFGFIAFCVLRLAAGRGREVPIAMYAVSAVFAFYYLMPALGLL
ncbi:hypothetical protein [Kitasatospora sp. NPDC050463]|uniref:hypothetical protein n=1 Tax=Kitasatospora sp. NPDC050463 TaxID=3155786 RepID=UPI0034025950